MDSSKKSKSKSGSVRRSIFNSNQPPQQQFRPPQQQFFPPQQYPHQYAPHPQYSAFPPQYQNPYLPPPPHQQSYSHQQYESQPNYSQYNTHSPQYNYSEYDSQPDPVETPDSPQPQSPDGQNEEIVETQKKTPFTKNEDVFLATAYVRSSDNPIVGTDQTMQVFWSEITSEYNQMAGEAGLPNRNLKSLKNRFQRMRSDVTLYNEAVSAIANTYYTGINETNRLEKVREWFVGRNKKNKNAPFKFDHVLAILNESSKFKFTTSRGRMPRDDNTNYGSDDEPVVSPVMRSGDGSTQESQQHHSGDKRSRASIESQEAISPSHPVRPIGSKAAKQAARKGKGQATTSSNSIFDLTTASDHRTTLLQDQLLYKRNQEERKYQLMLNSMEMEKSRQEMEKSNQEILLRKVEAKERLAEAQARKAETAARKADMEILRMDPNDLPTDEDREQLQAMRRAIWARWNP